MADWKTLEEANAEYDKLTEKIADMNKTAKEKQLELDALKSNASEDAKTIKDLQTELDKTKKVNYALSLRANVEQEKKSASELINNIFFGGEKK